MKKRIALVGVPLETVPLQDDATVIPAYIPDITYNTRKLILEKCAGEGIEIEDLGELDVGEHYYPGFRFNRIDGLPLVYANDIRHRDLDRIERARTKLLKDTQRYGLLIATGPSHLSAITLYEERDNVARYDYHADFSNWEPKRIYYSYATYMDWVKNNIEDIDVTNYFVKIFQEGIAFGHNADYNTDDSYKTANHFDIDVDCFNSKFRIQNVYNHNKGPAEATPEILLSMIRQAKPNKIGIWEYRDYLDYDNNGLEFILDAIRNLSE